VQPLRAGARRGVTALVALGGLVGLVALGAACSDDEGSAEELCAAVGDGSAFAATFEGFDPTDTDGALEQLRSARVDLGELRDVAPGEVRDDLSTQIDYVQALIEGLEAADPGNPGEAVAAVQRATTEHPEVAGAAERLGRFAEERC